jgi:hypothetical protein
VINVILQRELDRLPDRSLPSYKDRMSNKTARSVGSGTLSGAHYSHTIIESVSKQRPILLDVINDTHENVYDWPLG